jgi:hypothetical protein
VLCKLLLSVLTAAKVLPKVLTEIGGVALSVRAPVKAQRSLLPDVLNGLVIATDVVGECATGKITNR